MGILMDRMSSTSKNNSTSLTVSGLSDSVVRYMYRQAREGGARRRPCGPSPLLFFRLPAPLRYMSEHPLDPPLEMEPLPVQPSATGKSPTPRKLAQRDYAVGVCLLLLVVFLWTASNFVTEVRFDSHLESVRLTISYACTSGLVHWGIRETFPVCSVLSSLFAVVCSLSHRVASPISQRAHFRCISYRF